MTQSDDPEEESKQRSFTSLLNKLTVDNFERIISRMVELKVDEARTLKGFVQKIFNKALVESIFAELYAKLCKELLNSLPRCGLPCTPTSWPSLRDARAVRGAHERFKMADSVGTLTASD